LDAAKSKRDGETPALPEPVKAAWMMSQRGAAEEGSLVASLARDDNEGPRRGFEIPARKFRCTVLSV